MYSLVYRESTLYTGGAALTTITNTDPSRTLDPHSNTPTQTGFNVDDSTPGCPRDGAVRISRATNATVSNCSFVALGGGGVLVGNRSGNVVVEDSSFWNMGQSGVMFVGNDTTQSRAGSRVVRNTMRYIGQILASAGGVFVTSASNVYIGQNNISHSSRWGIAVRSNLGASSGNIAVEGNRISDTGLLTADFGAISFIDHTDTHNVTGNRVVGNCVQRTRGMRDATFQNKPGELMFPFWGRGLYLDDRSSNVEVSRNVFKDSSHAAVFVHGGCRNLITNNVFYHQGGVEFLIKLNKGWHIEGNAFERNVV